METKSLIGICLGALIGSGCGGDAATTAPALFGDLVGVVIDTHGSAIEGCHVVVEGLPQGADCQAGGRFRIPHIARGVRFVVASDDATGQLFSAALPVNVVGGTTATINLSLPDRGSVFGRVLAGAGASVRPMLVLARGLPLATATTADGWYLFPTVSYGLREIVAIGGASLTGTARVNVLGRTQADAIVLTASTSSGRITGRLVDGTTPGAAPPAARVAAAPLYAGTASAATSASDGRFDLTVTPGYYWLAVTVAGHAPGQVLPVGVLSGETRDVGDIVLASTDPAADLDGDGIPNGEDCDIDGDGYCNATTNCRGACTGTDDLPYNAWEHTDADHDGIGAVADPSDTDASNMTPLPPACGADFVDCDRSDDNGCEVHTPTDPMNCGGCGAACTAGLACVNGGCTASTCGDPAQGCCAADARHPLPFCANASLACCGGTCTDARSDPRNCGSCGVVCASGSCAAGACSASSCGGNGQPCCASGSPCGDRLRCTSGRCASATCAAVGATCVGGAGPCCAGLSCRTNGTATLCCREAGDGCAASAECCGYMTCAGGRCAGDRANGSACTHPSDCVSGNCVAGICAAACLPAGTASTSVALCCAGLAYRSNPTVASCCHEGGESCAVRSECCGEMQCTGGRCAVQGLDAACQDSLDCDTTAGLTCRERVCRRVPPGYDFTPAPPSVRFIDACAMGGTRVRGLGHACFVKASVDMPFPYRFYGVPYPALDIHSQGFAVFTARGVNNFLDTRSSPGMLPAYGNLPAVFPFAANLVQRDGVCSLTLGTAPNRRFVVETEDADLGNSTMCSATNGHLTFEVIFNERDNSMDFVYQRLDPSVFDRLHLIGVQEGAPTHQAFTLYESGRNFPFAGMATPFGLHVAPRP